MNSAPGFELKFDFSGRDVACFLFALSVHSLLLLWKGGLLTLPDQTGAMGDMLVNVDFRGDVPSFEPAGGSGPKPQGLLARMKSIIKGAAPAGKKSSELAIGNTAAPIETQKPAWSKTDVLTDKAFSEKKGFQGLAKKDTLDIAVGKTQDVLVKPSQGNFKEVEPNLKESQFKVSRKEMPFKIASTQQRDQLTNVNAIPVTVGRTTTASVKSLDGGPGAGPALQSKTFASKGATSSGFSGGFSGSGGTSNKGGGLAMGSASSAGTISGGAGSTGVGSGAGTGSGYGNGTGSGRGTGSGVGNGAGSGRAWGGGSGFGTGGTTMSTLPRNTVTDTVSSGNKSMKNSGFSITGALANRPIAQKSFARYEMDCRVSLRFRVDWSGKVLDGILVEVSSGSPTFDQKVIASLQQWMFSRLPADRANEIQEGVITFVFKGV